MKKFYSVDLFAGAGGLSLGLERAGFQIILANEIEHDFAETYRINHPNTAMIEQDVRKVDFSSELKNIGFKDRVHLLAGGPPCQGFSTVGKKREDDPRNNLFTEFTKAVEATNPDFVLFENVSGFKKMYQGRIFSRLCKDLEQLDYRYESAILNAVNFGLPQFRQRMILVGFKRKFSFKMPEGVYVEETRCLDGKPYRTLRDAISDLPEVNSGESCGEYHGPTQNDYQRSLRNGNRILTEHVVAHHGKSLLNVIRKVPYGGSILDVPRELRPKGYFHNTYARLEWDKPAPTLTRNFGTPSSSRCIHPTLHRGLTTREGARLQGFPDDYVFYGPKGAKNLQIGNAVPPILGYEIGKMIHESLKKFYKDSPQISERSYKGHQPVLK